MSTSSLIGKLQEINNSLKIFVYVPSAKKEMNFKQLSVKQQKDLMKTGLDGQFSGLSISSIIKDVIIDNSIDEYQFLATDKIPIILSLRKHSFGEEYSFSDGEKDHNINLNKILSKKLTYKSDFSGKIVDQQSKLEVVLEVPSLEEDNRFNNYIYSELKKKKDVELSDTVGVVYVGEIAKFLKSIKLGDLDMDLSSSTPKEKINLVENLPVTFNNKVLKFIESIRKEELDYATIDGVTVAIDARLFANQQ
jgi:hypothetical protein